MDDDIEQLLKALKLKRIRETLLEVMEWAEESSPSYTEFLRRLLRSEHTCCVARPMAA